MKNKTSRHIIAIDIGYGNTKMACAHGLDKMSRSRWSELCFPSIAPDVVLDEEASGLGGNEDRVLIELNGRRYYAGPRATSGIVARVMEPNYIETDLHEVLLRAALHFAMREMGTVIREVDMLMLGLPVSGYASQRDQLIEIGNRSRLVPVPKSLQGQAGAATIEVKIKKTNVIPQPYGAMRLAAQDLPTSDPIYSKDALSMVVDPGYQTLDWFVAAGMEPEMRLSGSYDGGVSSILRDIGQQIGFDHGTGSLEFDMVERGLETGKINLGHKVGWSEPME